MGAIELFGIFRCKACGAPWEGAELGCDGVAALAPVAAEVPLADGAQLAASLAEPISASPVRHGDIREAEAVEPVPADTLVADSALRVVPAGRRQ
jgi:hypothetical protein